MGERVQQDAELLGGGDDFGFGDWGGAIAAVGELARNSIHLELVVIQQNCANGVLSACALGLGVLIRYFHSKACNSRVTGATLELHAVLLPHLRLSILAALRKRVSGISVR